MQNNLPISKFHHPKFNVHHPKYSNIILNYKKIIHNEKKTKISRGPIVRGPTMRTEKMANWAPDSWAPGPNCPGPNCPGPNCAGPNLPRTKNLRWNQKWLGSKYGSILAAADLCLPHARLQEASAIYPTKLTPTLLSTQLVDTLINLIWSQLPGYRSLCQMFT